MKALIAPFFALTLVACGSSELPVQKNVSTAQLPSPPTPTPLSKLTLLGEWAILDGECAVAVRDGQDTDERNLTIESDRIYGYEWSCEIRPRIENGTNYEGKYICFDEEAGDEMPAISLTLELQDNGNLVKIDDGKREILKRC
jgi:hypothetical protein